MNNSTAPVIMSLPAESSLIDEVSAFQARHYRIVPFSSSNYSLSIYADVSSFTQNAQQELELLLGKKVIVNKIDGDQLNELLDRYYKTNEDTRQQVQYYHGDPDQFLGHLIRDAQSLNSSDIHIETFEENARVRIRIDGSLIKRYLLEKKQYPTLINKIKITAGLDIAEKRLPQDGRIFFAAGSRKTDIRVSVLPTLYGEKVVLRLLNNDITGIELSQLGFSAAAHQHFTEGIRKPNGLVLISGPTGSGKTTTLYATLKLLNKDTRNIVTIEDPIEYTLEGVNQVQLRENIGLSFGAALKTFLRQDPDIIMLGEIRDAETAAMAVRAALTGHLVLSTIHTNSAWGIVSRLLDMNIEPSLLADTLNTAVAQRLVKLLCTRCKRKTIFDASLYPSRFVPCEKVSEHFVATGCPECFNTGYKGRKAVYEVIPVADSLADSIKAGELRVTEKLKQHHIATLSQNAFQLFTSGVTSLEEVYPLLMN